VADGEREGERGEGKERGRGRLYLGEKFNFFLRKMAVPCTSSLQDYQPCILVCACVCVFVCIAVYMGECTYARVSSVGINLTPCPCWARLLLHVHVIHARPIFREVISHPDKRRECTLPLSRARAIPSGSGSRSAFDFVARDGGAKMLQLS